MTDTPKDLSAELYKTYEKTEEEHDIPDPAEPEEEHTTTHPMTIVMDTLVNTSKTYCKKQNLEAPNTEAYTDYARPTLNTAFSELLPQDSDEEISPYLLLALGILAMGLVYLPVILDLASKTILKAPDKPVIPEPNPQSAGLTE